MMWLNVIKPLLLLLTRVGSLSLFKDTNCYELDCAPTQIAIMKPESPHDYIGDRPLGRPLG